MTGTLDRTDSTNTAPPAGSIKSAERVMDLLDLVSAHPRGLSFGSIRSGLDLPKSSLHGLLRVMTARGYFDFDADSKTYRIGVRAWQVGRGFLRADQLAAASRPFLRSARDELNETVQMAILDGLDNVYIAKEESTHPLRLVSEVGLRLPAYTTGLGKVLLAFLAPEELGRRLAGVRLTKYTDRTISTHAQLREALAEIRKNDYAEDSGEYTEGLYCLAVPVRNPSGLVVAAMSCSIPDARLTDSEEKRRRVLEVLRSAARSITATM